MASSTWATRPPGPASSRPQSAFWRYCANATQALQGLSALGLSPQQALAALEWQINRQAHMLSAIDLFWVAGVLFLMLTFVIWISRPIHNAPQSAAGGAH